MLFHATHTHDDQRKGKMSEALQAVARRRRYSFRNGHSKILNTLNK